MPQRGYELALIPPVPLPRTLTPRLLTVPGRLAGAINAAASVLDRTEADVLVGFGGYVATPGYLAARRRKVPIIVHEANPRPGLANRLGARFTEHVAVASADTPLPHAEVVGIPLRREIATLDRLGMGDKARAHFGLRSDLPTLLVFGGSQGARSLNRALGDAVPALRAAGIQILHIVGPKNASEPEVTADDPAYVMLPYCDRMDLAYAAADFAMCRAGAITCAELTAVGLPAAYVPLPIGNGEQRLNAEPIVSGPRRPAGRGRRAERRLDQGQRAAGPGRRRAGRPDVGGRRPHGPPRRRRRPRQDGRPRRGGRRVKPTDPTGSAPRAATGAPHRPYRRPGAVPAFRAVFAGVRS